MLVSERLQLLREHHVDRLPEERTVVLVARCCGYRPQQIARVLHRSSGAVRHDLELAQAAILDALSLERDIALLTWWVVEHQTCCVAAAFSLVKNSIEFAS